MDLRCFSHKAYWVLKESCEILFLFSFLPPCMIREDTAEHIMLSEEKPILWEVFFSAFHFPMPLPHAYLPVEMVRSGSLMPQSQRDCEMGEQV